MSTKTSKLSALALAGFVSLSGIVSSVSPQAQAATPSGVEEQCEGVKINAALVVDNSGSIIGGKQEDNIKKAYNDFIDSAKKIDKNAKITIFPLDNGHSMSEDGAGPFFYYTKTFNLGNNDDLGRVKKIIDNFQFFGDKETWNYEDVLEGYGYHSQSDLYAPVKRVEVINKTAKDKFNLMITLSDSDVEDSNGKENIVGIGKNLRKDGVIIKSVIVNSGQPKPTDRIPAMTADKPQLGKDYFTASESDDMGKILTESLKSYCEVKKPTSKPKPTSEKPTSEKPTSEPTTEPTSNPTSEEPTTTPVVSTPTVVETTSHNVVETVTNTEENTSTTTQQVVETEKEVTTNTETVSNTQTVKKAPQTVSETAVETKVVDNPVPVVQPAQQVPTPVYGPKVHTGGEVKVSFLDKVKSFILG